MVTELLLSVLLVVGVTIAVAYFVYQAVTKQQTDVDDLKTRANVTTANLDAETRKLVNLKDDVNSSFSSLSSAWTSNVAGLDVFFQTTVPTPGSADTSKPFSKFMQFGTDSQGKARLDLMRQTTALSGFSALDLSGDKKVKLCTGTTGSNPTSCVEFPDSSGNLKLDAPTGKNILANKPIQFGTGPTLGANANANILELSGGEGVALKVNKLIIGGVALTADGNDVAVSSASGGGVLKFEVTPKIKTTASSYQASLSGTGTPLTSTWSGGTAGSSYAMLPTYT